MKLVVNGISALLLIFLSACHTEQNEQLREFNEVNDNIRVINKGVFFDSSYVDLNKQIQSEKEKNPELAEQAQIISQTTSNALAFMDSLKLQLYAMDPDGVSIDLGEKLIGDRTVSKKLIGHFNSVYKACNAPILGVDKTSELQQVFKRELKMIADKDISYVFYNAPTAAVKTLLDLSKTDCSIIAKISLKEIESSMVNHTI